jgi:hypothetical protein
MYRQHNSLILVGVTRKIGNTAQQRDATGEINTKAASQVLGLAAALKAGGRNKLPDKTSRVLYEI